jgi:hypothetical protein
VVAVMVSVVKVTAKIQSALLAVRVQKTAVEHQLVKSLSADHVLSDQRAAIVLHAVTVQHVPTVQHAHLVRALVDQLSHH